MSRFILILLFFIFFRFYFFFLDTFNCVVESSWLFVLRSEHDNLQFIRLVKYFIIRAGCLNLSNKKTKLLLYYLLLGKRFVKGLLTDIKNKTAKCTVCLYDQSLRIWGAFLEKKNLLRHFN